MPGRAGPGQDCGSAQSSPLVQLTVEYPVVLVDLATFPSPAMEGFSAYFPMVDAVFTRHPDEIRSLYDLPDDQVFPASSDDGGVLEAMGDWVRDEVPYRFITIFDQAAGLSEEPRALRESPPVGPSAEHAWSFIELFDYPAREGGGNVTFVAAALFAAPIVINLAGHVFGVLSGTIQCGLPDVARAILPGWAIVNQPLPSPLLSFDTDITLVTTAGSTRSLLVQERQALRGYQLATEYLIPKIKAEKLDISVVDAQRHATTSRLYPVQPLEQIARAFLGPLQRQAASARATPPCTIFDIVPDHLMQLAEQARSSCPYLVDRRLRGLSTDEFLPPGHEDLWAHQDTKASLWSQGRHHIKQASEHVSLLPQGLPPLQHACCASAQPSPFAEPMGIADDLDFALRTSLALGDRAPAWRDAQFRDLRILAEKFAVLRGTLDGGRSATSAIVSKHVRLDRLLFTTHLINWPDRNLTQMVRDGVTITGHLPHTGIYRDGSVRASVSVQDLMDTNDEWVTHVCSLPRPTEEQMKVVWNKSLEEFDNRTLRGWWTREQMDARWGRGKWRCLIRFAILNATSGKWRVIDNGRSASHNWSLSADERIHTTCVGVGAAMCRRLRRLAGRRLRGGCAHVRPPRT